MRIFNIKITQEIKERGIINHIFYCPIGLALAAATKVKWRIDDITNKAAWMVGSPVKIDLPKVDFFSISLTAEEELWRLWVLEEAKNREKQQLKWGHSV